MKIKITEKGIYGPNGEIKVGTEFKLDDEPKAWKGRYVILEESAPKDAKAVTNDKAAAEKK